MLASREVNLLLLKDKLEYLLSELGISQKTLAGALNVSSDVISHWKKNGRIPNRHINSLCKYLGGIKRSDLESCTMEEFRASVQNRWLANKGDRWKAFIQLHRCLEGLDIEIVFGPITSTGLKGIYQEPQPNYMLQRIKRVFVNDGIRFKLSTEKAKVSGYDPQAFLLVIENPETVQIFTPDIHNLKQSIHHEHYSMPSCNFEPLYVGLPMGMHVAYWLSLANTPPNDVWQTLVELKNGYAVDNLVRWLIDSQCRFKINLVRFIVNS